VNDLALLDAIPSGYRASGDLRLGEIPEVSFACRTGIITSPRWAERSTSIAKV
jgi:hypothetical protein